MSEKSKLVLALDWTPNTNHSGFYWAQERGLYADAGLHVQIQPPSEAYTKEETPARRVMDSTADLCICPSESVISCWTSDKGDKALPVAVAAVLQDDYSAIVSPSAAGVKSPRELDGRRYASYER